MPLTVWQLDPAQLTPYYNIALCDALAVAGCHVRYIASTYLYDTDLPFTSNFQTDYVYFRGLDYPWLVNHTRLRRILRGISYPLGHLHIAKQLHDNPPDVLHIQWSRVPRFDRWLIREAKKLRIPVVHTVHNVVSTFASQKMVAALENVYTQADSLVVHTEASRKDLLHLYPKLDPQRLHVIPLIANLNTSTPPDASMKHAREILHLPDDATIVLFFGAIRHYKGLDILLSAFQQAARDCSDLHLIIAGRPDTEGDKSLLEFSAGLTNVHVYSGYIPYDRVWEYHLAADVIVFPYRQITQSAALISAMAFGRAVIATDIGGLPETVEGNGWIVPPENPSALCAAILEAAENRDRTQQMGYRSLVLIAEKYAGSIIAQRTIEVYKKIIG